VTAANFVVDHVKLMAGRMGHKRKTVSVQDTTRSVPFLSPSNRLGGQSLIPEGLPDQAGARSLVDEKPDTQEGHPAGQPW